MSERQKELNMRMCDFCYTNKVNTYGLCKIILKTNIAVYEISMSHLLEKVANWAMSKLYHLSASQIVLLRPDLLYEFFKEDRKNEQIKSWMMKEYVICFECYEHYKEQVPAK